MDVNMMLSPFFHKVKKVWYNPSTWMNGWFPLIFIIIMGILLTASMFFGTIGYVSYLIFWE